MTVRSVFAFQFKRKEMVRGFVDALNSGIIAFSEQQPTRGGLAFAHHFTSHVSHITAPPRRRAGTGPLW